MSENKVNKWSRLAMTIMVILFVFIVISCNQESPQKFNLVKKTALLSVKQTPKNLVINKENIQNKKWHLPIFSLTKDSCELVSVGDNIEEIYLNENFTIQLSTNYILTSNEWLIENDTITVKLIGEEVRGVDRNQMTFSIKNSYKILELTTEKMLLKKINSFYEQVFFSFFIE